MESVTSYHQLGKFIVLFQNIEEQIDDLILLLTNSDDELISILINQMEFSQKIKKLDVIFARFVDKKENTGKFDKNDFHSFINKVIKQCERRNALVHSRYYSWLNIEGKEGLLRENAKNSAKKGLREIKEEEILPEDLAKDIEKIEEYIENFDKHRNRITDWLGEFG